MSVPSPNTERRPGIRRGAIPSARGPDGRAFCLKEREYALSGHQSQKGRENIPVAGTHRRRGESRTERRSAGYGSAWARSR
eukprot:2719186-Pyramimonas_sp.AAC.1